MSIAKHLRLSLALVVMSGATAGAQIPVPSLGASVPATHVGVHARDDGPPLSLEDAIREALTQNSGLVAARRQVDPLRAKPIEAQFLPPPMFETEIWQWPINTINPANVNMYMFTVSQDLPGRGKRQAQASLADANVRVAETAIATDERQVIGAVSDAYWRLSIARRTIRIHLASVDLIHELTDVAQAKYAAGRLSQQDVLKAVVEASRLHDDVITFELQASQAQARLNALLNRPLDSAVGPLNDVAEATLVAPVADLQALAVREQPALRTVEAQINQAEAQRAVAASTGTPDWSIGAGYMLQPHQTDGFLAKLSLTWPRAPWSRGAIDARVAGAAAAIGAAKAESTAVETQVRLAVEDAYLRVKAAEERAALLRTTLLPQARQTLDVSRLAYETDRVDFLVVIENQRTLLDIELEYERALTDWRQAMADLERATGASIPAASVARVATTEGRR